MTEAAPTPRYDLLGAEYDHEPVSEIRRSLVICSTPRSGSTLLGEAAFQTERLGVPAEYLALDTAVPYLFERWGCESYNEYVSTLQRLRASPNGVFGIKVHWAQLLQFSSVSQGAAHDAPVEFKVLVGVLLRVAPKPALVFVTRRDKARQAVSHWIASQTQRWFDHGETSTPPVPEYDFAGIQRMMNGIEESEASWARFFTMGGVEPTRVVYEDFVADYAGTVKRVAAEVGVPTDDLPIPAPRMRKQSRSVSTEYADRYRREVAAQSTPG
jgi:LPS sulfotransferase NodH